MKVNVFFNSCIHCLFLWTFIYWISTLFIYIFSFIYYFFMVHSYLTRWCNEFYIILSKHFQQCRVSVVQPTWIFFPMCLLVVGLISFSWFLSFHLFLFFKIFKILFHNSFFFGSASSFSVTVTLYDWCYGFSPNIHKLVN